MGTARESLTSPLLTLEHFTGFFEILPCDGSHACSCEVAQVALKVCKSASRVCGLWVT